MAKRRRLRNQLRRFGERQEAALGTYVYALSDPRDRKVFYVGMGQDSRVLAHFDETDTCRPSKWMAKHRRISDIWAEDLDVRWHILRRNLQIKAAKDGDLASHVEAAVIDALDLSQNGMTLNEIRGTGVATHGSLSEDEVVALAATPVNPTVCYPAVFLFPIHVALKEGRDIYDGTRRAWVISKQNQNLARALGIGVAGGVSRGVFEIEEWRPSSVAGRHEFIGRPMEGHELLNKNCLAILGAAMGYWQRGNYLIVELNGRGQFRFIRGAHDKKTWINLS